MKTWPLKQLATGLYVDPTFADLLHQEGLDSIEALFRWDRSNNLTKPGLAAYRSRFCMRLGQPPRIFFMKRFESPPLKVQILQWLTARRHCSCAALDLKPLLELPSHGIATPRVVAFGDQWTGPFEKRSVIITEQLPDAESLERKRPVFFQDITLNTSRQSKRVFITSLAQWIARFHALGYCHRDLYLSHIFYDSEGQFYLIDLTRVFKPQLLKRRYLVKDLAQLYYSTPADCVSRTDLLRFYRAYTEQPLSGSDKRMIRSVLSKAQRMARHDLKHQRPVPFMKGRQP